MIALFRRERYVWQTLGPVTQLADTIYIWCLARAGWPFFKERVMDEEALIYYEKLRDAEMENKEMAHVLREETKSWRRVVERITAERDKLEEELGYYANKTNWYLGRCQIDGGERARIALQGTSDETI